MKTTNYFLVLVVLTFITWSCTSTNDLSDGSLKSSLNNSVLELTTAMTTISNTPGYQVLSISSSQNSPSLVRSSVLGIDTVTKNIVLSDITGIYDYKAIHTKWMPFVLRFFTKTADNTQMIVRLPESKVKNFKNLFFYSPADTLLANDYIFTLSDYQYKFNLGFNHFQTWNYQMASTINIKNVDAGSLKIKSSNSTTAYKYASEFKFADNYTAKCDYSTGDTAVAIYAITDGTKTLYEEKYTSILPKQKIKHFETEYSLSIGNVTIVRKQGPNALDSAKVYVAGVLQSNSKVEIIDIGTDTITVVDKSIVKQKRDLKITFDDGTSTTLTELLGTSSLDTIRNLFTSLRQASFATSIVDVIAWDVFINK